MKTPRSTARDLHEIIKHDVALSAKILKVVNSAFYGLPRQVASVDRAIVLLGLSTVKNIVLATSIAKLFSGRRLSTKYTPRDLWRHSLACGVFCKLIAKEKELENEDEVFVVGLMHDIGIMVEMQVYPNKLSDIIDASGSEGRKLREIEMEVLGADHQAFGAALANKWKFPPMFQLATGSHHDPMKCAEQFQTMACAVHFADFLANLKEIGLVDGETSYCEEALDILGFTDEQVNKIIEKFDEQFGSAEAAMIM